jgi:steroid delta-isomerase-like uncharacterized protein
MSLENHRRLAREYIEQVWGRHDHARALVLLARDYVDHNPPPGVTPDRAGLLQVLDQFAAAFPDATLTLEAVIVEGDLAADRWTLRGRQHAPFLGLAPTGRLITLRGMDFHRLAGGQIHETWHIEGGLGRPGPDKK